MDIKESFDNSKPQVLLKCITALINDYLAQPAHPAATAGVHKTKTKDRRPTTDM